MVQAKKFFSPLLLQHRRPNQDSGFVFIDVKLAPSGVDCIIRSEGEGKSGPDILCTLLKKLSKRVVQQNYFYLWRSLRSHKVYKPSER